MNDENGIVRQQAELLLYQAEDDRTSVEVLFGAETVWLSFKQMAELFHGTSRSSPTTSKTYSLKGNCNASQLLQNLS